ncbi:DUF1295 domain-containing protein [Thermosulfurimonas marina]|uniref:DUF1295 domain-containing protein n=1 Tax=Thermosulfurimonas marina TaxID=2047767 RepID=A0A6H1WUQ8_9BACT|nr:methyltransferase [Thermosulfurimonas marina]QJA06911.1 DUF1295 domain-containing protein [Thermosulfurimonas marina]
MDELSKFLAWLAVLLWPIIPLFWVPLHLFPSLRRRLGRRYYPVIIGLWSLGALVLALANFPTRWPPLSFPAPVRFLGALALLGGTLLQVLTAFWLREHILGRGILDPRPEDQLVTEGPFRYLRHPTYVAHALFFWGIFFFSGYPAVALVALGDLIFTWGVIVPREERELEERFGALWREYARRTPRVLPRWRSL